MKIVLVAVMAFFLLACSQNEKESATTQVESAKIAIEPTAPSEPVQESPQGVAAQEIKPQVEELVQNVEATVAKVEENAQKVPVEEIKPQAKEIVKNAETPIVKINGTFEELVVGETIPQVERVSQKVSIDATKVEESVVIAEVDGSVLYKTCASCHGQNGEKQALNKSQIIKGWESSKTVAALKGYKDGTYGGAMKAMMKGQVAKLSDAEIAAVAKHISGL